jgi:3'-phosphoadenosine 5'-phosphosulfate sulfotransferase (PAPS reductase)/FAD synthetase
MTKHIVSLSGGKDSTAMLLMMIEKGMPIDEIVFCDTGKEYPQMHRHIDKLEEYIGRPITRIKGDKTFDELLEKYGWPFWRMRWCTSKLKQDVIRKYIRKHNSSKVVEYLGIAYDEQKRARSYKGRNIEYPLVEWEVTEAQALSYCYSKGFKWEGLYKFHPKVSCYCCPFVAINSHRINFKHFPKLWGEVKRMDELQSVNKFRSDYSVDELQQIFETERRSQQEWVTIALR